MDTTVLDHFLVIAETLSITKTAEKVYKSESVLSRQLSRLEEELGLQLFYRSRTGLSLTPAGEIMRDALIDIKQIFHDAHRKGLSIQSGKSGVINIGLAQYHALTAEACQFFSNFTAHHPGIELNFASLDISELDERLRTAQIDFIYGAVETFSGLPSYFTVGMEKVESCLIVSTHHPSLIKPRSQLSLFDFKDDPFLVLDKHSDMARTLSIMCHAAGFQPELRRVNDIGTLMTMIQFGNGVTCSVRTNTSFFANQMTAVSLPQLGSLTIGLIGRSGTENTLFPELVEAAHAFGKNNGVC